MIHIRLPEDEAQKVAAEFRSTADRRATALQVQ